MKNTLVNGFIVLIISRILMWFMVGYFYTEPISYETKMIITIFLWIAAIIVVLVYLQLMVIANIKSNSAVEEVKSV